METIKVINNGVQGLDWLIEKYENQEANQRNIRDLQEEVYECFIDVDGIDFSTKGGTSVTIVDIHEGAILEFIYANN